MADHVFNPEALAAAAGGSGQEQELEAGLRPGSLEEFVGQGAVVENLRLAISAARMRSEPTEHVLLSGPPGLGKTSLARILAGEMDARLLSTSGPALERPKDLVGILTQLQRGDVLFIDEIHRVPTAVEEYLYTAMEDFSVDLTLDSGPHARIMTLTLEPFTLVGATTREGLLSAPFRTRFGIVQRLDPYPGEELERIVLRAAGLLGTQLDPVAAQLLADRSRGTPRIANRFLRRARDVAQVGGHARIDEAVARETLERLGVDDGGLEEMDRRILRCLARAGGQPVGVKTIAATVDETEDTIVEVFEPHLLREGLVLKTARGRVITRAGLRAAGLPDDPDAAASGSSPGGASSGGASSGGTSSGGASQEELW